MPPSRRHPDDFTHRYALATPTREDPTLVVCPSCEAKAFVIPAPTGARAVRVVCHACGYADAASGQVQMWFWHATNPTDGYFGLPLWLQTRCCGRSLWAFNRRHLNLLEGHVGASLRERRPDEHGWRNGSVLSRLPRWMTKAGNREAVLASLRQLREQV